MKVSILVFEQFNEIDVFVAFNILNRVGKDRLQVNIASNKNQLSSMNGVVIQAQQSLEQVRLSDAVLFSSGRSSRALVENSELVEQIKLDVNKQLIGSQCSGALFLAKLGLLSNKVACSDNATKPFLEKENIKVLQQSFYSQGSIATVGGCLSSPYLAAWVIMNLFGEEQVRQALQYVAPVGTEYEFIEHIIQTIK